MLNCCRNFVKKLLVTDLPCGLDSSVRCASKKAGTSSKNKRSNTRSKKRGGKKFDGDYVEAGMILLRQLGLKVYPGQNVGCGKDLTLFALRPGRVMITKEKLAPYPHSPLYPAVRAGRVFQKFFFHIVPVDEPILGRFKLVSSV